MNVDVAKCPRGGAHTWRLVQSARGPHEFCIKCFAELWDSPPKMTVEEMVKRFSSEDKGAQK